MICKIRYSKAGYHEDQVIAFCCSKAATVKMLQAFFLVLLYRKLCKNTCDHKRLNVIFNTYLLKADILKDILVVVFNLKFVTHIWYVNCFRTSSWAPYGVKWPNIFICGYKPESVRERIVIIPHELSIKQDWLGSIKYRNHICGSVLENKRN